MAEIKAWEHRDRIAAKYQETGSLIRTADSISREIGISMSQMHVKKILIAMGIKINAKSRPQTGNFGRSKKLMKG